MTRQLGYLFLVAIVAWTCACSPPAPDSPPPSSPAAEDDVSAPRVLRGRAVSADGVEIDYTATGQGELALVLIHGGFADATFWREQVEPLSESYRVVTLDLAGHGASGADRSAWSIDAFGEDVRSVVEELGLEAVVLVGNSLGGPVALAAAERLPGVARGLIAVDTFQDVTQRPSREQLEPFVRALREEFPRTCDAMVRQLLVPDTDAALAAWVHEKMCSFDAELAPKVVESFYDYDLGTQFAAAEVPVRAILGGLTPVALEANRALRPEFEAVVMEGLGHYPMLERPEEFNRHLTEAVEAITNR